MLDFLSIGDSIYDTFLIMDPESARVYCQINEADCEIRLNYADKIPVSERMEAVGGNAANAAVSAARLGLRAAIVTEVGKDRAGDTVVSELAESGVITDYVVVNSASATNCNTVISVAGERTILTYHQPRLYRLPQLPATRWLYVTSMKDGYESMLPALVSYIRTTGASVCFQPGTYQLKNPGATKELLAVTTAVVMNKEEAQRYTGLATDEVIALLDGLRAMGPRIAVITDGRRGCYAKNDEGTWFLGTIEDIPRVEATGAGDAFTSALASALVLGKPLPEAMRWGLAQASHVIQRVGAQAGLIDQAGIQAFLEQYADIQTQPYNP